MIVTMALTGAVLYAVALLIGQTVGSLNFLREKSESIQSATLGCERLCSELRETIVTPTTGTSVTLVKVMPSAPVAVGNPERPLPPPAPPPALPSHLWNRAYGAGDRVRVTYAVSGDHLTRQAASDPATVVATRVNAFNVSAVPNTASTYQVDLSIQEKIRVLTYTAVVFCPGVTP
jgi:hypothetical protein